MSAYTVTTPTNWLPPLTGKPPAANELQRRLWTAVQQRDLPGQATQDQYGLANQYVGANFIALNAIARGFSTSIMQVLKRRPGAKPLAFNANDANMSKDWIPVEGNEGPAKLFATINDQQTPSRFAADYVTCRQLFGRAFIYAPPTLSGKPYQLWNILPQYVQPMFMVNADYPLGAWRVTLPMPMMYGFSGAGTVIIDARQMVEERLFNSRFPTDGYSPLTAGAQQIDTLNGVNEARKNTMDRGPSVDAVIAIAGASQEELQRKKTEHENKYSGSRGGKVMFTDGEDVKATALGISAKDMDFAAGYDQLTNFVLGLHGVPHPVAGLTDTSSYAQLFASLQQFRTLTLIPMANEIAAHWTKHLIQPHWGDEYAVTFVFPKLTNAESEEQTIQQLAQMGVYTVDEVRAKRNEDPIEGGKGAVPPSVYLSGLTAEQQQAMQPPQPGMEDPSGVRSDTSNDESGLESDDSQPGGELGDMLMSGVMDALGGDDETGERVTKARAGWTAVQTANGKTAAKNTATGVMVYGKRAAEILAAGQPKPFGYGGKGKQKDGEAKPEPVDLTKPNPLKVATSLNKDGLPVAKVAKQAATAIAEKVEQHVQTPEGQEQAKTIDKWAPALAKKHADTVAAKLGIDKAKANDTILQLIQELVTHIPVIGRIAGKAIGIARTLVKMRPTAKRGTDESYELPERVNRVADAINPRTGGSVTPPKNKAGKGSLPPRLGKSFDYDAESYFSDLVEEVCGNA